MDCVRMGKAVDGNYLSRAISGERSVDMRR